MQIPTLADTTVLNVQTVIAAATFAAFDLDKQVSFVRDYTPTVQAIADFRHAVIRYRNTDGKTSKPAKMVTVPQLKLTDNYLMPENAAKVLLGVLEDEQDAMIRSMIDTQVSNIYWANLTLDKVFESLTAIRLSNRLTKEQIEGWSKIAFLAACNERADQISQAKGFNAEQSAKQRAGTLNAYCELAMKLAAPVPNIGQNQATALKNMILIAKLDDDMSRVLLNKIEAILNPKIVENNDL
jgi:hypothetical protein